VFFSESGTRNFRNLETGRIKWDRKLNLLIGPNGAGKTNILESLHILTGWGPFKSLRKSPLLNWDSDESRGFLEGTFEGEEDVLVQSSVTSRCAMKCDGKRSNCASIRFRVPALAFLPGDLALIEGGPSVRRRFLDVLCALLYPIYALKLTEYRRAVRHKRALLSEGRSTELIDSVMAPMAEWIWTCREKASLAVTMGLESFSNLLPGPIELALSRGGIGLAGNNPIGYIEGVRSRRRAEIGSGRPLVGPHRDDLTIDASGMEASSRFSRGQRRRTSLAMVMAAGWAVERKLRRSPILLLDEVASELDQSGREITVETLVSSGWQIFAATAEDDLIRWPGSLWTVREGRITRREE
jgi:DNA replication and repair protein RecF